MGGELARPVTNRFVYEECVFDMLPCLIKKKCKLAFIAQGSLFPFQMSDFALKCAQHVGLIFLTSTIKTIICPKIWPKSNPNSPKQNSPSPFTFPSRFRISLKLLGSG